MNRNFDPRIADAVEGRLKGEDWSRFQSDLLLDETLRASYVSELWLHQSLVSCRTEWADLNVTDEGKHRIGVMSRILWPLASAASLLVGIAFWLVSSSQPKVRPVAVIVQAENCKWGGSDLPTAVNSHLGAGTLALVEGIATLQFESGSKVILEGPSKFQIQDAMHCRLIEGAVTAEVPASAHGFTIDAPDLRVVDLGTRFGMTASVIGTSQVRVFEGEVDVYGMPDGNVRRLTKGKGLHFSSGNTMAGQEPVRGQQSQGADGWISIPTSFGAGKDAFTRRSDEGPSLGSLPILIVKHTDLKEARKNERRAIITFDVSQIDKRKVLEAQLSLEQVPSGFGFSALVPDSVFAIYGISDETLDSWEERSLRWNETPACNDDGPDLTKAKRLAEFCIPRGGGGIVNVKSDAISDLLRADTNGLVSFLIVRETGESDPNGLAHGFASKEHPSAQPPTLRIKCTPDL